MSGEPYHEVPWEPRVYTFEEFEGLLVSEHGPAYEQHMQDFKNRLLLDQTLDTRMFAAKVVEEAWQWMKDKSPAIILFYSSLYSPRIEVTGKNEREKNLMAAMEQALELVQPHYRHNIVIRNFFPYISDMSFVALSDDEEGIRAVCSNNPAWGSKHYVEYQDIRDINVPVINIGPYGYDAHKKYERMEMSFSLEVVPNLTNEIILKLLEAK